MNRITAAGTVTLRQPPDQEPKVLLVHRPAYKDWTLPKGKNKVNEYRAATAWRETDEETGRLVRLGVPLNKLSYPVGGGTKDVYYWRGMEVSWRNFKPNHEIDQVSWVEVSAAESRMTYADERELVQQALQLPQTTALMILRHASARPRRQFNGKDPLRPLAERGRKQAKMLVPLLQAFGVRKLASSSSRRCMATLAPYAQRTRLTVESFPLLSEEQGIPNPKAVSRFMKQLAAETASSNVPMALCGHRPVLPTMFEALGIDFKPMSTATAAVVHLDAAGQVVAVEWHRSTF